MALIQYVNGRTTIAQTARAAENGPETCGSLQKKQMVSVGSLLNGCATIGILQLSQHHMPRDFADMPQSGKYCRSRVIVKYTKSGEPVLH
jgi:hypothetical protein